MDFQGRGVTKLLKTDSESVRCGTLDLALIGWASALIGLAQKTRLNPVQSLTLNQVQSSRHIGPGSIFDFEPARLNVRD